MVTRPTLARWTCSSPLLTTGGELTTDHALLLLLLSKLGGRGWPRLATVSTVSGPEAPSLHRNDRQDGGVFVWLQRSALRAAMLRRQIVFFSRQSLIIGSRARQSCWNSEHYGPSLQGSSHHLLTLQMCVSMISTYLHIYTRYLHNLARPRDLYCGLNISCAAAGHIKVRLGTAACSWLTADCSTTAALLPSSCFLLDTDYIIPLGPHPKLPTSILISVHLAISRR